jgi:o-succinylbenzoate synthase
MNCWVEFVDLQFIRPAGTSRGILHSKSSWILHVSDGEHTSKGEISVIPGLSPEYKDRESFEEKIREVCACIEQRSSFDELRSQTEQGLELWEGYPSIRFGVETALLDLQHGGRGVYFDNAFARGEKKIPINGLVWMGTPDFMEEQIEQKLKDGFSTIKMKIGAIELESELSILRSIRERYSSKELTLRVDANGAFNKDSALSVLEGLAKLEIHSIEQPIAVGQIEAMRDLCKNTPVPIALDEELIGINSRVEKEILLETIRPQYIILKPSLHGGISGTKEWIRIAEEKSIPWWMTSALESNIGLNAICQFTAEYENDLPQGLGTGSLYKNNFQSELLVEKGEIYLKKD